MNIDWSKAPENCIGATISPAGYRHLDEGSLIWIYNRAGRNKPFVGFVEQQVVFAGEGGWPWFPKPEPWNGEGLPPVGTVCEVKGCMSHYLQWNKVTVFAVRGKTVMFDMEDGRWGQTDSHEFRPIRTPEQIAAEERAERIAEIAACMAEYLEVETPNEKMMSLSTYLHDHGCRRGSKP